MSYKKGSAVVWVVIVVVLLGLWWVMSGGSSAPASAPSSSQASAPAYLETLTANGNTYLADLSGKTLYTKSTDVGGVSSCDAKCLVVWPAYSNGGKQYNYKNMPLYYYSGDKKIGDTSGDGVNKVWYTAKP